MQKQDKALIIATIGLLTYTLSLSFLGPALSALQTSKTVGNQGTVRTIGVGVYWNQACTNQTTSIPWGTLDPGSNKSITCYIKNEGNNQVTLSMSTSNWNPANAGQYLTLTWNLQSATLNAGQVRTATFTLAVSASITGITSFSFDITVVGTS